VKLFYQLLSVSQPFWRFSCILVLSTIFPFNEVTKFLELFVESSNFPGVSDDLTFHDPFYLPFEVSLGIFWDSWRLLSSFSY